MGKTKDSGIEWIGQIPENWNLKRIQFCLDEINEKNTPVKTEQVLSLVKDKGIMLYEDKGNQGNKAKEDVSQYKIAYPNTLIVNSMNILIGSVGISDYLGCVSPVYYVFKETDESDLRYINYIFNTREFQRELRKYANGILDIRLRVSSSDIFRRKIPLPDKIMQKKIADFLDVKCAEIDILYSDIEKQIKILEEYKKSIITEIATKGLDPDVEMKDSGIEWIGEIPQKWQLSKVKYHVIIENGTDPKTDGDIPVYGSGADSFKTCGEYKNGPTVLLGRKGATLHIPHYIEGKYWNVDTAFNTVVDHKILLKYFYFLACCFDYKYYISQTTLPGMTQTNYGNMCIPFPNISEQTEIVEYLEKKCLEIENAISEKVEQLATLEEYKKSLIYEYVTGKKEVPDNE